MSSSFCTYRERNWSAKRRLRALTENPKFRPAHTTYGGLKYIMFKIAHGKKSIKNARLLSYHLHSYIVQRSSGEKIREPFVRRARDKIIFVHSFCCRVAEETNVYVLDHFLKDSLVAYIALEVDILKDKGYIKDRTYQLALLGRVKPILTTIYSKYYTYLTGKCDKTEVYEMIWKFFVSEPLNLPDFFDEFLNDIKDCLPPTPKNPDLPYFSINYTKSKENFNDPLYAEERAQKPATVIDLTDENPAENVINVNTEAADPVFMPKVWDQLKYLQAYARKQFPTIKPITSTKLIANTEIYLSDSEEEVNSNSKRMVYKPPNVTIDLTEEDQPGTSLIQPCWAISDVGRNNNTPLMSDRVHSLLSELQQLAGTSNMVINVKDGRVEIDTGRRKETNEPVRRAIESSFDIERQKENISSNDNLEIEQNNFKNESNSIKPLTPITNVVADISSLGKDYRLPNASNAALINLSQNEPPLSIEGPVSSAFVYLSEDMAPAVPSLPAISHAKEVTNNVEAVEDATQTITKEIVDISRGTIVVSEEITNNDTSKEDAFKIKSISKQFNSSSSNNSEEYSLDDDMQLSTKENMQIVTVHAEELTNSKTKEDSRKLELEFGSAKENVEISQGKVILPTEENNDAIEATLLGEIEPSAAKPIEFSGSKYNQPGVEPAKENIDNAEIVPSSNEPIKVIESEDDLLGEMEYIGSYKEVDEDLLIGDEENGEKSQAEAIVLNKPDNLMEDIDTFLRDHSTDVKSQENTDKPENLDNSTYTGPEVSENKLIPNEAPSVNESLSQVENREEDSSKDQCRTEENKSELNETGTTTESGEHVSPSEDNTNLLPVTQVLPSADVVEAQSTFEDSCMKQTKELSEEPVSTQQTYQSEKLSDLQESDVGKEISSPQQYNSENASENQTIASGENLDQRHVQEASTFTNIKAADADYSPILDQVPQNDQKTAGILFSQEPQILEDGSAKPLAGEPVTDSNLELPADNILEQPSEDPEYTKDNSSEVLPGQHLEDPLLADSDIKVESDLAEQPPEIALLADSNNKVELESVAETPSDVLPEEPSVIALLADSNNDLEVVEKPLEASPEQPSEDVMLAEAVVEPQVDLPEKPLVVLPEQPSENADSVDEAQNKHIPREEGSIKDSLLPNSVAETMLENTPEKPFEVRPEQEGLPENVLLAENLLEVLPEQPSDNALIADSVTEPEKDKREGHIDALSETLVEQSSEDLLLADSSIMENTAELSETQEEELLKDSILPDCVTKVESIPEKSLGLELPIEIASKQTLKAEGQEPLELQTKENTSEEPISIHSLQQNPCINIVSNLVMKTCTYPIQKQKTKRQAKTFQRQSMLENIEEAVEGKGALIVHSTGESSQTIELFDNCFPGENIDFTQDPLIEELTKQSQDIHISAQQKSTSVPEKFDEIEQSSTLEPKQDKASTSGQQNTFPVQNVLPFTVHQQNTAADLSKKDNLSVNSEKKEKKKPYRHSIENLLALDEKIVKPQQLLDSNVPHTFVSVTESIATQILPKDEALDLKKPKSSKSAHNEMPPRRLSRKTSSFSSGDVLRSLPEDKIQTYYPDYSLYPRQLSGEINNEALNLTKEDCKDALNLSKDKNNFEQFLDSTQTETIPVLIPEEQIRHLPIGNVNWQIATIPTTPPSANLQIHSLEPTTVPAAYMQSAQNSRPCNLLELADLALKASQEEYTIRPDSPVSTDSEGKLEIELNEAPVVKVTKSSKQIMSDHQVVKRPKTKAELKGVPEDSGKYSDDDVSLADRVKRLSSKSLKIKRRKPRRSRQISSFATKPSKKVPEKKKGKKEDLSQYELRSRSLSSSEPEKIKEEAKKSSASGSKDAGKTAKVSMSLEPVEKKQDLTVLDPVIAEPAPKATEALSKPSEIAATTSDYTVATLPFNKCFKNNLMLEETIAKVYGKVQQHQQIENFESFNKIHDFKEENTFPGKFNLVAKEEKLVSSSAASVVEPQKEAQIAVKDFKNDEVSISEDSQKSFLAKIELERKVTNSETNVSTSTDKQIPKKRLARAREDTLIPSTLTDVGATQQEKPGGRQKRRSLTRASESQVDQTEIQNKKSQAKRRSSARASEKPLALVEEPDLVSTSSQSTSIDIDNEETQKTKPSSQKRRASIRASEILLKELSKDTSKCEIIKMEKKKSEKRRTSTRVSEGLLKKALAEEESTSEIKASLATSADNAEIQEAAIPQKRRSSMRAAEIIDSVPDKTINNLSVILRKVPNLTETSSASTKEEPSILIKEPKLPETKVEQTLSSMEKPVSLRLSKKAAAPLHKPRRGRQSKQKERAVIVPSESRTEVDNSVEDKIVAQEPSVEAADVSNIPEKTLAMEAATIEAKNKPKDIKSSVTETTTEVAKDSSEKSIESEKSATAGHPTVIELASQSNKPKNKKSSVTETITEVVENKPPSDNTGIENKSKESEILIGEKSQPLIVEKETVTERTAKGNKSKSKKSSNSGNTSNADKNSNKFEEPLIAAKSSSTEACPEVAEGIKKKSKQLNALEKTAEDTKDKSEKSSDTSETSFPKTIAEATRAAKNRSKKSSGSEKILTAENLNIAERIDDVAENETKSEKLGSSQEPIVAEKSNITVAENQFEKSSTSGITPIFEEPIVLETIAEVAKTKSKSLTEKVTNYESKKLSKSEKTPMDEKLVIADTIAAVAENESKSEKLSSPVEPLIAQKSSIAAEVAENTFKKSSASENTPIAEKLAVAESIPVVTKVKSKKSSESKRTPIAGNSSEKSISDDDKNNSKKSSEPEKSQIAENLIIAETISEVAKNESKSSKLISSKVPLVAEKSGIAAEPTENQCKKSSASEKTKIAEKSTVGESIPEATENESRKSDESEKTQLGGKSTIADSISELTKIGSKKSGVPEKTPIAEKSSAESIPEVNKNKSRRSSRREKSSIAEKPIIAKKAENESESEKLTPSQEPLVAEKSGIRAEVAENQFEKSSASKTTQIAQELSVAESILDVTEIRSKKSSVSEKTPIAEKSSVAESIPEVKKNKSKRSSRREKSPIAEKPTIAKKAENESESEKLTSSQEPLVAEKSGIPAEVAENQFEKSSASKTTQIAQELSVAESIPEVTEIRSKKSSVSEKTPIAEKSSVAESIPEVKKNKSKRSSRREKSPIAEKPKVAKNQSESEKLSSSLEPLVAEKSATPAVVENQFKKSVASEKTPITGELSVAESIPETDKNKSKKSSEPEKSPISENSIIDAEVDKNGSKSEKLGFSQEPLVVEKPAAENQFEKSTKSEKTQIAQELSVAESIPEVTETRSKKSSVSKKTPIAKKSFVAESILEVEKNISNRSCRTEESPIAKKPINAEVAKNESKSEKLSSSQEALDAEKSGVAADVADNQFEKTTSEKTQISQDSTVPESIPQVDKNKSKKSSRTEKSPIAENPIIVEKIVEVAESTSGKLRSSEEPLISEKSGIAAENQFKKSSTSEKTQVAQELIVAESIPEVTKIRSKKSTVSEKTQVAEESSVAESIPEIDKNKSRKSSRKSQTAENPIITKNITEVAKNESKSGKQSSSQEPLVAENSSIAAEVPEKQFKKLSVSEKTKIAEKITEAESIPEVTKNKSKKSSESGKSRLTEKSTESIYGVDKKSKKSRESEKTPITENLISTDTIAVVGQKENKSDELSSSQEPLVAEVAQNQFKKSSASEKTPINQELTVAESIPEVNKIQSKKSSVSKKTPIPEKTSVAESIPKVDKNKSKKSSFPEKSAIGENPIIAELAENETQSEKLSISQEPLITEVAEKRSKKTTASEKTQIVQQLSVAESVPEGIEMRSKKPSVSKKTPIAKSTIAESIPEVAKNKSRKSDDSEKTPVTEKSTVESISEVAMNKSNKSDGSEEVSIAKKSIVESIPEVARDTSKKSSVSEKTPASEKSSFTKTTLEVTESKSKKSGESEKTQPAEKSTVAEIMPKVAKNKSKSSGESGKTPIAKNSTLAETIDEVAKNMPTLDVPEEPSVAEKSTIAKVSENKSKKSIVTKETLVAKQSSVSEITENKPKDTSSSKSKTKKLNTETIDKKSETSSGIGKIPSAKEMTANIAEIEVEKSTKTTVTKTNSEIILATKMPTEEDNRNKSKVILNPAESESNLIAKQDQTHNTVPVPQTTEAVSNESKKSSIAVAIKLCDLEKDKIKLKETAEARVTTEEAKKPFAFEDGGKEDTQLQVTEPWDWDCDNEIEVQSACYENAYGVLCESIAKDEEQDSTKDIDKQVAEEKRKTKIDAVADKEKGKDEEKQKTKIEAVADKRKGTKRLSKLDDSDSEIETKQNYNKRRRRDKLEDKEKSRETDKSKRSSRKPEDTSKKVDTAKLIDKSDRGTVGIPKEKSSKDTSKPKEVSDGKNKVKSNVDSSKIIKESTEKTSKIVENSKEKGSDKKNKEKIDPFDELLRSSKSDKNKEKSSKSEHSSRHSMERGKSKNDETKKPSKTTSLEELKSEKSKSSEKGYKLTRKDERPSSKSDKLLEKDRKDEVKTDKRSRTTSQSSRRETGSPVTKVETSKYHGSPARDSRSSKNSGSSKEAESSKNYKVSTQSLPESLKRSRSSTKSPAREVKIRKVDTKFTETAVKELKKSKNETSKSYKSSTQNLAEEIRCSKSDSKEKSEKSYDEVIKHNRSSSRNKTRKDERSAKVGKHSEEDKQKTLKEKDGKIVLQKDDKLSSSKPEEIKSQQKSNDGEASKVKELISKVDDNNVPQKSAKLKDGKTHKIDENNCQKVPKDKAEKTPKETTTKKEERKLQQKTTVDTKISQNKETITNPEENKLQLEIKEKDQKALQDKAASCNSEEKRTEAKDQKRIGNSAEETKLPHKESNIKISRPADTKAEENAEKSRRRGDKHDDTTKRFEDRETKIQEKDSKTLLEEKSTKDVVTSEVSNLERKVSKKETNIKIPDKYYAEGIAEKPSTSDKSHMMDDNTKTVQIEIPQEKVTRSSIEPMLVSARPKRDDRGELKQISSNRKCKSTPFVSATTTTSIEPPEEKNLCIILDNRLIDANNTKRKEPSNDDDSSIKTTPKKPRTNVSKDHIMISTLEQNSNKRKGDVVVVEENKKLCVDRSKTQLLTTPEADKQFRELEPLVTEIISQNIEPEYSNILDNLNLEQIPENTLELTKVNMVDFFVPGEVQTCQNQSVSEVLPNVEIGRTEDDKAVDNNLEGSAALLYANHTVDQRNFENFYDEIMINQFNDFLGINGTVEPGLAFSNSEFNSIYPGPSGDCRVSNTNSPSSGYQTISVNTELDNQQKLGDHSYADVVETVENFQKSIQGSPIAAISPQSSEASTIKSLVIDQDNLEMQYTQFDAMCQENTSDCIMVSAVPTTNHYQGESIETEQSTSTMDLLISGSRESESPKESDTSEIGETTVSFNTSDNPVISDETLEPLEFDPSDNPVISDETLESLDIYFLQSGRKSYAHIQPLNNIGDILEPHKTEQKMAERSPLKPQTMPPQTPQATPAASTVDILGIPKKTDQKRKVNHKLTGVAKPSRPVLLEQSTYPIMKNITPSAKPKLCPESPVRRQGTRSSTKNMQEALKLSKVNPVIDPFDQIKNRPIPNSSFVETQSKRQDTRKSRAEELEQARQEQERLILQQQAQLRQQQLEQLLKKQQQEAKQVVLRKKQQLQMEELFVRDTYSRQQTLRRLKKIPQQPVEQKQEQFVKKQEQSMRKEPHKSRQEMRPQPESSRVNIGHESNWNRAAAGPSSSKSRPSSSCGKSRSDPYEHGAFEDARRNQTPFAADGRLPQASGCPGQVRPEPTNPVLNRKTDPFTPVHGHGAMPRMSSQYSTDQNVHKTASMPDRIIGESETPAAIKKEDPFAWGHQLVERLIDADLYESLTLPGITRQT